jgi:hypothetical protein
MVLPPAPLKEQGEERNTPCAAVIGGSGVTENVYNLSAPFFGSSKFAGFLKPNRVQYFSGMISGFL